MRSFRESWTRPVAAITLLTVTGALAADPTPAPSPTPRVPVIKAAPATPSPSPTPAEPTPTPCVGKFSCIPLDEPIEIVKGIWVRAGQRRSFVFDIVERYAGGDVSIPVTMIRGTKPGPTLLFTSTIHGDELNGVPVLLHARDRILPDDLAGLVILLPVINPYGFRRQTRYLPDRRDLNRYFPGHPRGSLASRIAHRIFTTFVLPSDYLVDFHTASGGRSNAAHVRADPESPESVELAQSFGGIVVLQDAGEGTIRHEAVKAGVPTAVFEGGEDGRLSAKAVETGLRGVENVLSSLEMVPGAQHPEARPLLMTYSPWIRANTGGVVELAVGLGDLVQENQLLLTIRDTLFGDETEVRAPHAGIVMSVARSPVAEPGFALIRLGILESPREPGRTETPAEPEEDDEIPE